MISHRLMMGCGEVKSLGKQEIKAACSQPSLVDMGETTTAPDRYYLRGTTCSLPQLVPVPGIR